MKRTLHIPKKGPRIKPRLKVYLETLESIRKKAEATIREIDRGIEESKALRVKFQSAARTGNEIRAVGSDGKLSREGIHELTRGGVCHRPDLFLNGGRACDSCGLFPWCLKADKRLKVPGSQPKDRNKEYFDEKERDEETMRAKVVKRPRIILKGKAPLKKLKVKLRK